MNRKKLLWMLAGLVLVAGVSLSLSVAATLLSEIAPKVVAKRHPEKVAVLAIPMLRVLEADTEISLELVENNTVALFTAPGDYSYIVVPLTRGETR